MAYDIFGGGTTIDGIARATISSHTLRVDNPHSVTKAQVGLSDVVNVDTTTTSNIIDSTDKRFVSDAQKAVLNTTSGTNTGDENTTTIINKIGYTPENTLNKGVNNGYCGLDSGGKVPLQNLPSTLLKYIGTWNAETNTPSLTATDLTKISHVYVVSHAGTQFGIIWKAGDWLIYDADGIADKSDNSDDVVSVNGKTGIVIINKADVGLSNVDNTSDLNKPISTLTQTALTLKADKSELTTHTTNTSNPHGVTKTQVGLSNVVNVDTTTTANITDTTTKRFVSDTEKTMWGVQKNERPGITWTSISVAANEWRGCVLGNGRFVAVARTGTHQVIYSTDAITWTPVVVPLSTWNSIAYGNGLYVAVGDSGTNRVMHSVDGINWTPVAVDLSAWLSVTYANGLFVAVATGGTNRVMYSVGGINWISVAAPSEMGELIDITYGNGRFVAVARTGTHRVMYSTDAITWTPVVVESSEWNGITYGNGRFVAVARTGTHQVIYSTDAITWTPVVVPLSTWNSIAYGNGLYVAVSEYGPYRCMYSLDATNWYYNATVPLSNWRNIAYVNDIFIAFAYIGDVRLMTSGRYLYSDKVRVVKKSVIGELSASILSTEWTGTRPFEDTIPITIAGEQITNTTHDIKVSLVLSSDINIARQEQEAYSYFSKGEISATNLLKITCFDYKPSVNLNLLLEVAKKW